MYEHGTYAKYKLDNCRCYPCCGAGSAYRMNRSRAIAYGTWQPFVDAGPVRRHVEHLRECGLGLRRIAELAGLSLTQMRVLMNGLGAKAPSKRIRPTAAQAILGVEPTPDNLAPKTHIDAAGSHRRLQALVCVGWSQSKLAGRLGMSVGSFGTLMRTSRITVGKARQIRGIYDDLWDQAPPESTHHDKIAASRARNYAAAHGWLPPMAWDDELIDLPTAEFAAELDRQIAQMDEAELQRCRYARWSLGERSPLIVAGAREKERRRHSLKEAS